MNLYIWVMTLLCCFDCSGHEGVKVDKESAPLEDASYTVAADSSLPTQKVRPYSRHCMLFSQHSFLQDCLTGVGMGKTLRH